MISTSNRLNTEQSLTDLQSLLKDGLVADWDGEIASVPIARSTIGFRANEKYFDNDEWASNYLRYVHRSKRFKARWLAATGDWAGKVVVDVGCGPGNVQATLKQSAKVLVGVDISRGSLKKAAAFGYIPLRADAQDLPLRSECADLVIANAALHHCDDMRAALRECARLVRKGGRLVIDHDPQRSAWNFRGVGYLLWKSRLLIYRVLKKGFHRSFDEQSTALLSEIHHDAGKGVTPELFRTELERLGFTVDLYPHNHDLGAEVLEGQWGRGPGKFRWAQRLSLINPDSPEAASSLMCRAVRTAR